MNYDVDFENLDNEELIEILSVLEGMDDVMKEMVDKKNETDNNK